MNALILGHESPFWKELAGALRTSGFSVGFAVNDMPQSRPAQIIFFQEQNFPSHVPRGSIPVLVLPFISNTALLKTASRFKAQYPQGSLFYIGEGAPEYLQKQTQAALRKLFGFTHEMEIFIGNPITTHVSATSPIQQETPPVRATVPVPLKKEQHAPRQPFKLRARAIPLLFIAVSAASLPFVVLALSALLTFVSVRIGARGDYALARRLFGLSKSSSELSASLFLPFVHAPVIGEKTIYFYDIAGILSKSNQLALTATDAIVLIEDTLNAAGSRARTSWPQVAGELSRSLTLLYRDSSFLRAQAGAVLSYQSLFPQYLELEQYLEEIPSYASLVTHLPTIIGNQKPVTYMILFQNNMELRPTGGFVGSFALVTFENGKLNSKDVYDVYDADGMLNGYVEPPEPIRKYLKEASWNMRDANWDPDFSTSARRMSWFLEKSMDRQVQGVIGVDLNVLQSLLSIVGPITIDEFGDTLDAQNMYSVLQSRVEEQFFPGTSRKKTYLAYVAEELLFKLQNIPLQTQLRLVRELDQLFASRSIQVWFQNEAIAGSIADLGWDGSSGIGDCGACEQIYQSLNEANVGVNKANVAVSRSVDAKYTQTENVLQGVVSVELTHNGTYQNNGNESYKSYMRLLVPHGATIKNVRTEINGELSIVKPEVKLNDRADEVGIFIEVPQKASAYITFTWEKLVESKAVEITWQKQAGVAPFKLALTVPGTPVYNTTLRGIERIQY